MYRHTLAATLVAAIVACNADPIAPDAASSRLAHGPAHNAPSDRITALGANVYLGADADAALAALANADPADDLPALTAAITTLQLTAFPLRAAALADEIARNRPHFVGLQELSDINIELPPLGIDIELDFLEILRTALEERGLQYIVAARVRNFSVMLTPFEGAAIEVVDRDAILVDARRVSFDPASVIEAAFSSNIGQVAPGINIVRGWVGVRAVVRGRTYLVANTHLESGDASPLLAQLRAGQALELVTLLGSENPVIVMGDFNDVPGSPMHQVMTGAGFSDVWLELEPGDPGFTCCQAPDLSNDAGAGLLNRRLDYIFVRGAALKKGELYGRVELFGNGDDHRIEGPAYPIWPSDHAGIVAEIRFPKFGPEWCERRRCQD